MSRGRGRTRGLDGHNSSRKQEPRIKSENDYTTPHMKQEPDVKTPKSKKRMRTQAYENLDADEVDLVIRRGLSDVLSDGEEDGHLLEVEEEQVDHDDGDAEATQEAIPKPQKQQPRYYMTCKLYKSEIEDLPGPVGLRKDVPAHVYKRSRDLAASMKEELDHEHFECSKIRKSRKELNKKFLEIKKKMVSMKDAAQQDSARIGELRLQIRQVQDESAAALARPLAGAQIKIERINQEYDDDVSTLRANAKTSKTALQLAGEALEEMRRKFEQAEMEVMAEKELREAVQQQQVMSRETFSQLRFDGDTVNQESTVYEEQVARLTRERDEAVQCLNEVSAARGNAADKTRVEAPRNDTIGEEIASVEAENKELKEKIRQLIADVANKEMEIGFMYRRLGGGSATPTAGA